MVCNEYQGDIISRMHFHSLWQFKARSNRKLNVWSSIANAIHTTVKLMSGKFVPWTLLPIPNKQTNQKMGLRSNTKTWPIDQHHLEYSSKLRHNKSPIAYQVRSHAQHSNWCRDDSHFLVKVSKPWQFTITGHTGWRRLRSLLQTHTYTRDLLIVEKSFYICPLFYELFNADP